MIQNNRATIVAQGQQAVKCWCDIKNWLWIDVLMLQFTFKGMIEKWEGICPVIWMSLHNSGICVWIHGHSRYGVVIMYSSTNFPRCVMPLRSQAHAVLLYSPQNTAYQYCNGFFLPQFCYYRGSSGAIEFMIKVDKEKTSGINDSKVP